MPAADCSMRCSVWQAIETRRARGIGGAHTRSSPQPISPSRHGQRQLLRLSAGGAPELRVYRRPVFLVAVTPPPGEKLKMVASAHLSSGSAS